MKIRKSIIFLTALFLITEVYAGKIEKAFAALGKYDYFTAKELFEKSKEKEPVAAPYGLSIIFGRPDNPFYNLDSAHIYVSLAETAYPSVETKELESLQELGINASTMGDWKDSIDHKAWERAIKINSVEGFQAFIDRNTDADQLTKAIANRDQLAFDRAREVNSARSYKVFTEKYPDSEQFIEAQNRYEERLFEEFTAQKNLRSYESFIKRHPESPYIREAQDSIYSITTMSRTISAYEDFIRSYPNNPNTDQAWRNVYKLYTSDYSSQRIIEFRIEYPDYPFIDELMTDMKLASKVFFPFRNNRKYGYMDETGEVMINADYEAVENYSEGLGLVVKDGKIGFINKAGETDIPFEYDEGESFNEGLAIVAKDDLYGMVDRTNKAVVPLQFDLIGQFSSGLALVANDTAYGYVNKNGQAVVPLQLEYATDFENSTAIIDMQGKKGIINTLGRVVVPVKYSWIENFNDYKVCRAKNDTAYGLIDDKGAEILAFEYDRIGEFGDSLALVAKDGKYGYVNTRGEIVIPLQYDFTTEAMVWGRFEDGTVKFQLKGKYGIINNKGEKVFPAIFEDVGQYSETELIAVKKRGKWGYSDQNLKLALPYKYELSKTFMNGLGQVKTEDGWQLIDLKGKFVLDSAYSEIRVIDSLYYVSASGKWGLLNKDLKLVVAIEYDNISHFQYRYLRMEKGEELFYYDPKLNVIISPKL